MGNPIEDLKQKGTQQAKNAAKNAVKNALKSAGRAVWSAIAPVLPYIIIGIVIFIIIIGCIDWDDVGTTASAEGMQDATGSSWEQFLKFLHSWEDNDILKDLEANIFENEKGEKCYKVKKDGGGGLAVGYGVDSCHANELKDKNGNPYSFNEGDLIPVDVVDSYEEKELNECKTTIQNSFTAAGVQCTEYQLYALISFVYNNGTGSVSQFCSGKGMGKAYKEYYTVDNKDYYKNKDKFDENLNEFAKTFMAWDTDGLLTGRRRSELCLFETGYYGYDLPYKGHGMDEYWQESYGGTGEYNSNFYGGIEIYNKDGSVNAEKMEELDTYLTKTLLNTKYHHNTSEQQSGPFAKWWTNNGLSNFQCTWWANGRASQYLELTNSSVGNKYPTTTGHGKDYYNNNQWFKSSKTEPRANSIISWSHGDYGHVAYVEAVDEKTGDIWISHAGGGDSWFGIAKLTKASGYAPAHATGTWEGYTLNGFVYLDQPK